MTRPETRRPDRIVRIVRDPAIAAMMARQARIERAARPLLVLLNHVSLLLVVIAAMLILPRILPALFPGLTATYFGMAL